MVGRKFIDFVQGSLKETAVLARIMDAKERSPQDKGNDYNLRQEEKTQLISTIIANNDLGVVKQFLIEGGFDADDFENAEKFKKVHLGTDEQLGVVYYAFLIPPRVEIPIHSHTGPCSSAHFAGGKAEGHYRDIDVQSALATDKKFADELFVHNDLPNHNKIESVALNLLYDSRVINPVKVSHSQPGETTYVRPSEVSVNISLDENSGGITYDKKYFEKNARDIKSYLVKQHGFKIEKNETEEVFQERVGNFIEQEYGASFLSDFTSVSDSIISKFESAIEEGKKVAENKVSNPDNFADFHTVINTDHNKPTVLIHTYSLTREIGGKVARIPDVNGLPVTADNYANAFKHSTPGTLKVRDDGDQRYMPVPAGHFDAVEKICLANPQKAKS